MVVTLLSRALLLVLVIQQTSTTPSIGQKNVLLMFIDDGGFQMGVYGNKAAKTPNIDNFAKRAVLFKHGFTSVSSCSPSRSALLTGVSVLTNMEAIVMSNVFPNLQVCLSTRMGCTVCSMHLIIFNPSTKSKVFLCSSIRLAVTTGMGSLERNMLHQTLSIHSHSHTQRWMVTVLIKLAGI